MADQYRGGAATPGAGRDDADSLIGPSTNSVPSSGATLYPNPSAPPPGSADERLQNEELWRRELESVYLRSN